MAHLILEANYTGFNLLIVQLFNNRGVNVCAKLHDGEVGEHSGRQTLLDVHAVEIKTIVDKLLCLLFIPSYLLVSFL